jgi:ubiquinone/menaquinone biosynthesis C-methylase UbiE
MDFSTDLAPGVEDIVLSAFRAFLARSLSFVSPSQQGKILDVRCGSGIWAHELAATHPDLAVTGIESNRMLVRTAEAIAALAGIENALFQQGPLHHLPLDSYQTVYGSFLFPYISPQLIHEMIRLCTSGGQLILIDVAALQTNSESCQIWSQAFLGAFQHNPAMKVEDELRAAGCHDVTATYQSFSLSYGERSYIHFWSDFLRYFDLLNWRVLSTKTFTYDQLQESKMRIMIDILQETFRSELTLVSIIGTK